MVINTRLIAISFAAIVLSLSSITKIKAHPVENECADNNDCYSSLTCMDGACIDPCKVISQNGRATCTVNNHMIKWTCNPGFEYVRGLNHQLCLPVAWSCNVDQKDPDLFIKCAHPNWYCVKSFRGTLCGLSKTTDDGSDDGSNDRADDESDYESDSESE